MTQHTTRPDLPVQSRGHEPYPGHPVWFYSGVAALVLAVGSFFVIAQQEHRPVLAHYVAAVLAEITVLCVCVPYMHDDHTRDYPLGWGYRAIALLSAAPLGVALRGAGLPVRTCFYVGAAVAGLVAVIDVGYSLASHRREE